MIVKILDAFAIMAFSMGNLLRAIRNSKCWSMT
jgi:hypothetical protein